jgi:phosphoribosyl 1,2-cyclic phosphodiesterase
MTTTQSVSSSGITASSIADELKGFIASNQEFIRTAREEQKEHEAGVKNKVSSIKEWEKQIKAARLALVHQEPKRKNKKTSKKTKKNVKPATAVL